MRKIYTLILAFFCVVSIQAQRHPIFTKTVKPLSQGSSENSVADGFAGDCDTINYPVPDNWNLTYYTLQVGGFVAGTNGFNDQEKASYFDLSSSGSSYISGAWFYFAAANASNSADLSKNVIFKVYEDNNGQPGSQIGMSVEILYSSIKADVDSNLLTSVMFPEAIGLPDTKKFYVSADFSNLSFAAGDSISLVSTTIGDIPPGTGNAWEKWDDGSWNSLADTNNYGVDWDFAIFPFVSSASNGCAILPVKLISFTAERSNKDVMLKWNVADEFNMKGYEIEKADNNNNYRTITFLPAANDLKNHTYTYTDANAFTTSNSLQYRLKQVDGDGKVQYSRIIPIKALSALTDLVFANPFNNTLRLQVNLASSAHVGIRIYDMQGHMVAQEKPTLYSGSSNTISVPSTSSLKSGIYILKVTVDNEQYNYKIIKN